MQKVLADKKLDLVLKNNYVKGIQKVHYLYSLKVYEWRLNDNRLVGNFNWCGRLDLWVSVDHGLAEWL